MSTIKVKINRILVPKEEFLYCDVMGVKCHRTICFDCERKNPKREKLLRDKNNLREETDEELRERLYVFFNPD